MLKVHFVTFGELRMGSPHIQAEVRFTGGPWKPDISERFMFADNISGTDDQGRIALAAWQISMPNGPAFRVILIDPRQEKVLYSDVIEDGPGRLEILDAKPFEFISIATSCRRSRSMLRWTKS